MKKSTTSPTQHAKKVQSKMKVTPRQRGDGNESHFLNPTQNQDATVKENLQLKVLILIILPVKQTVFEEG